MAERYEKCVYCGRLIDFSGAAIVTGTEPSYQPFMEDWRGGPAEVAHPECFAEREGTGALLAAVAREDERRR